MKVRLLLKVNVDNFEDYESLVNYYQRAFESHRIRGDAGIDMFSPDKHVIAPGEGFALDHKVGIRLQAIGDASRYVPYIMMPRSSAGKQYLVLRNSIGLIDSGYSGNLMGNFLYFGKLEHTIMKFARVCQITTFGMHDIVEFKVVNMFDASERGEGGFGSTGE